MIKYKDVEPIHDDSDNNDDFDDEDDANEDEDDQGWEDWIDEDAASQSQATKSLFSEEVLPTPEKALQFDKEKFKVDIIDLVTKLGELASC